MATSPTVRRRRLTAELCRLRDESGRTIEEVADRTGISKSSLSRIENGVVGIKIPVLRALLVEYGVSGERAASLEQLSKEASLKGWWQSSGAAVLDGARTLIGLEAEASKVDDFSLAVIPGLLQTPRYAEATIRASLPEATTDAVASAVDIRMRRQARIGELRFWTIIAEEAFVRPIGGAEAMNEQVAKLLEVSEMPQCRVQILGREEREHPGMAGPFAIISFGTPTEQSAVYLEGNRWDACLEDDAEIEFHRLAYDNLRALALSPKASQDRLLTLMKGFDQ